MKLKELLAKALKGDALTDDEKKFLIDAVNGTEDTSIPISHRCEMLKTLQYHGLVDASKQITKRGLHVAAKLPQPKQETNGDIQGQDGTGLDHQPGSSDGGRDQTGSRDRTDEPCERSIAETADGTSGALRSDSGDLSGADGRAEPDSGTVPEAAPDATGFDSDWD
jgi:hypothetical protein